MAKLFTPEELEALRLADAELDEDFVQTQDEIRASRQRDKQAKLARMDNHDRKIAENRRAYREANKEKIAENRRAYYEANKEKVRKYMREYMREYMRKKRAARGSGTSKDGKEDDCGANCSTDKEKNQWQKME